MFKHMRPDVLVWSTMATITIAGLGCGKEELAKITAQVQEATVEKLPVEVPKIKIAPVGEMQLTASVPVSVSNLSVSVLVVGDGRPNVMQIQLSGTNPQAVPAVFVRGETTATSAAQLVGQTMPVKMFVQPDATGVVWSSPDDRPVSITFDKLEDTEMVGRIQSSVLISTDGVESPVSGSFRAVITQPNTEVRTTMYSRMEGCSKCS